LISNEKIDMMGMEITPVDFLAKFVGRIIPNSIDESTPEGGAVMVVVKGKKGGKEITYEFSGTARMKEATATPAALAAVMMARGEIISPGVKAPEDGVPAKKFLNKLMKTGIFGKVWMSIRKEIDEL